MKTFHTLPPSARHTILVLLPVLIFYAIGLIWSGPRAQETGLEPGERTLVFAHGGGQGLAPPNSLAAMEAAFAAGTDFFEIDIHETSDGHLVLMHDETVDRTSNGSGSIEDMTLKQIKALRLGGDDTIKVPTLTETFERFPKSRFLVELKLGPASMPANLCRTIRHHDMTASVIVASFHGEALQSFRRHCREVATSLSKDEVTRFVIVQKLGLPWLARLEGSAFHVPVSRSGITIITPRFVRAAHARGLDVIAWTINDEAEMRRLAEMGVDGLITDYPGVGLQVAEGK